MEQILKRLLFIKAHPELAKELSNLELVQVVLVAVSHIQNIQKALDSGELKGADGKNGVTPRAGKHYLSIESARKELKALASKEIDKLSTDLRTAIKNLRDGKDGKDALITEKHIKKAAELAFEMIESPEFDPRMIAGESKAVRDALELLDGEERLSIWSLSGVSELLEDIEKKIQAYRGNGGGSIYRLRALLDVNIDGITNGQTLVWNEAQGRFIAGNASGSGVTVETPTGTVDGNNTSFSVTAEPKWVVSDGITYFDGAGYTYAGLSLTMDVAPSAFIRAII